MSDKGSVGAARGYRERNPRPWCDATMDTDELQYVCDRLPGHDGPHRDRDIAEWTDADHSDAIYRRATGKPPAGPSDAPAAPAARSPEAQCNCHAGPPDLCPHHGPLIRKALAEGNYFDVVFDGPPEHEAGRFVECEDSAGRGVNIGRWFDRGDGTWGLRILIPSLAGAAELAAESRGAKAARGQTEATARAYADAMRVISILVKRQGGEAKITDAEILAAGGSVFTSYDTLCRHLSVRVMGTDPGPPGSPSVPAAQQKDQANQGAPTREAPEPGGALSRVTEEDVRRLERVYQAGCEALAATGQIAETFRTAHVADEALRLLGLRVGSRQPRAAPSDSAPATPGLGTQEGLEASAAPPRSPEKHSRACYNAGARAAAEGTDDPGCTCGSFVTGNATPKEAPPILENATRDALASDKPAAGPSSPSSASLESGGGTLDTNKAEGGVKPRTPEGAP